MKHALMDMVLSAIVGKKASRGNLDQEALHNESEEPFELAFAELKRRAQVRRFEVKLRGRTFIFTAEDFEELENH
jgi:hypothetical protein